MVAYDIRYGLTGPFVPHVGCVRDPSPQTIFKRNSYNTMTVGFARGYAVIMQVRKDLLILENDGSMLDRHQALMIPTAPPSQQMTLKIGTNLSKTQGQIARH